MHLVIKKEHIAQVMQPMRHWDMGVAMTLQKSISLCKKDN